MWGAGSQPDPEASLPELGRKWPSLTRGPGGDSSRTGLAGSGHDLTVRSYPLFRNPTAAEGDAVAVDDEHPGRGRIQALTTRPSVSLRPCPSLGLDGPAGMQ